MPLPSPLRQDLAQLRTLRFHRYDACADLVRWFYRLKPLINAHPLAPEIQRVHEWLLSPLTLQALDFPGLARHILSTLQAGREFDADLVFLLGLIADPPDMSKIARMREHEEAVAEGRYDSLSREPARYREVETAILSDSALRESWAAMKRRYRAHQKAKSNLRGVVKRTLARERGFEPRHPFKWHDITDRFQITFDALCHRWCLYGCEKNEALALKVTANPTPHGTMIFIPRNMSLDGTRTLVWREINRIHRAHGAVRQGKKLSSNRLAAHGERQRAKQFDAEARQRRLRGDARYIFVLRRMGKPIHMTLWVKRLIYS